MRARELDPARLGVALVGTALLIVPLFVADRPSPVPAARTDPVPYDGRSPAIPAGERRRVLLALPRPSLGARMARDERLSVSEQRAYVRSLERESLALRGSLRASGVSVEDVVPLPRTWGGFAATVRSRQLARVEQLGVRIAFVRRFYPATAVWADDRPFGRMPPAGSGRTVALLDTGVETSHPLLRGRMLRGYDVVDGDRDPSPGADPRDRARRERSGTALASVLARAGARVLPIRVAGLEPVPERGTVEEVATTDRLIAGLERAVDPDGDGASDDAVPVALVGLNAPYAGFARSPEARAASAAGRLGTLVVAPAGNESLGPTVGSPGAAPGVATVGAQRGGGVPAPPVLDVELGGRRLRPALLGGTRPLGRVPVTVIRVRRGDGIGQAHDAVADGARAVLLADPADRAVLPAASEGRAGGVPILGLTGAAARHAIDAGSGEARFGAVRPRNDVGRRRLSAFSSHPYTLAGHSRPEQRAPASSPVALVGGGTGAAGGTAVAAAQLAAGLPEPDSGDSRAERRRRPVPVGPLRIRRERGRVTGVRFTLGSFDRGIPGRTPARIEAVERLRLDLLDSTGTAVAALATPDGGARELLPGVYAYALRQETLDQLPPGRYRFRVGAIGPAQGDEPTVRRSPSFRK